MASSSCNEDEPEVAWPAVLGSRAGYGKPVVEGERRLSVRRLAAATKGASWREDKHPWEEDRRLPKTG